jgi:hypothetical protein
MRVASVLLARQSRTACCDAIDGPAAFHHVSTSHDSHVGPVDTTDKNFKPREPFFLLSLSFLSLFSLLSLTVGDRLLLLLPRRRVPSSAFDSPPTPVLYVTEGTFSLLTE